MWLKLGHSFIVHCKATWGNSEILVKCAAATKKWSAGL